MSLHSLRNCPVKSKSHCDRYLLLLWQLRCCFCGASSLTRGRICILYMLLALASAVFLRSESQWTGDHILLSQIWDFPFCFLLRLAGSRWRYSTPPPHGYTALLSQSQSHIATDGQPVIKSSWPDIYYCLSVTVLFLWGTLSDERTGPSFVYAAGPCQRSHSWVRVPWDSTIFCCLRFETSLFIASYHSQGHGGGIRPRLHCSVVFVTGVI
jgi:hypothetical protein